MKLNIISSLIVFSSLFISLISCECRVNSQTYSTNDGIVISEVAHIITFSAQCDGKQEGLTLFADFKGKTLPAIRSLDSNTYQISWTVELSKSSSGSHSIPIYDEEGFAQLRKAQRSGDASAVKPLFTLEMYHSGPYKGPWIQTELVATLAAVLVWWLAYTQKNKLTA